MANPNSHSHRDDVEDFFSRETGYDPNSRDPITDSKAVVLDADAERQQALRELMSSLGSVAQAGIESGELDTKAIDLPDPVLERAAEIERSQQAE